MSLDAIKSIGEAEDNARRAKQDAVLSAKRTAEEAERQGRETVAATIVRAEAEVKHLKTASDQKAAESARELLSTTANKRAALRAKAESRLDAAAGIIVERIVGG